MLEYSKNAVISEAYIKILENSRNGRNEQKNWGQIKNHNRVVKAEKEREIVPSRFANCLTTNENGVVVLTGDVAAEIIGHVDYTTGGTDEYSMECRLTDDGNHVNFDIVMHPLQDGDFRIIKAVNDHLGRYAPWIALHKTMENVDYSTSHAFIRYEINDDIVLNKVRKLLGRDSERTDLEQMTFDFN